MFSGTYFQTSLTFVSKARSLYLNWGPVRGPLGSLWPCTNYEKTLKSLILSRQWFILAGINDEVKVL